MNRRLIGGIGNCTPHLGVAAGDARKSSGSRFASSDLGPIELVGQIHEELAQKMIDLMLEYAGLHVFQ